MSHWIYHMEIELRPIPNLHNYTQQICRCIIHLMVTFNYGTKVSISTLKSQLVHRAYLRMHIIICIYLMKYLSSWVYILQCNTTHVDMLNEYNNHSPIVSKHVHWLVWKCHINYIPKGNLLRIIILLHCE
jgi:hypothetical protein